MHASPIHRPNLYYIQQNSSAAVRTAQQNTTTTNNNNNHNNNKQYKHVQGASPSEAAGRRVAQKLKRKDGGGNVVEQRPSPVHRQAEAGHVARPRGGVNHSSRYFGIDGTNPAWPRADTLTPMRVECCSKLITDTLATRDMTHPQTVVAVPLVLLGVPNRQERRQICELGFNLVFTSASNQSGLGSVLVHVGTEFKELLTPMHVGTGEPLSEYMIYCGKTVHGIFGRLVEDLLTRRNRYPIAIAPEGQNRDIIAGLSKSQRLPQNRNTKKGPPTKEDEKVGKLPAREPTRGWRKTMEAMRANAFPP